MVGRHQKRSAIGIEGEAGLVRFLLQRQRDQICDRTLIAVMGPDETLSGKRTEGWKSLPVPRGRTDGAFKLLPESSEVGSWHGRVQKADLERSDSGPRNRVSLHVGADELDDIVHGRAGLENRGHAGVLERPNILVGDDAADQYKNIVHL